MTDIVARLRNAWPNNALLDEAAAEIELLSGAICEFMISIKQRDAEIERLKREQQCHDRDAHWSARVM